MRCTALAGRNLKEAFRDPVSMILGMLMPVGYLVLFTLIARHAPVEVFEPAMLTPAITVFSFVFLVMFSAGILAKDRGSAFLARLLSTPLRPVEFILAYSLPFFLVAFVQIFLTFVTGILLGVTPGIWMITTTVFLLPTALSCIALGMIFGSLFTETGLPAPGTIAIVVISFFSGAWMDIKMIGGTIETIAYILPFAHAVDAARSLIAGAPFSEVLGALPIVIGYAVFVSAIGVLCFRWRTKR